jgi:hypothetical protein
VSHAPACPLELLHSVRVRTCSRSTSGIRGVPWPCVAAPRLVSTCIRPAGSFGNSSVPTVSLDEPAAALEHNRRNQCRQGAGNKDVGIVGGPEHHQLEPLRSMAPAVGRARECRLAECRSPASQKLLTNSSSRTPSLSCTPNGHGELLAVL